MDAIIERLGKLEERLGKLEDAFQASGVGAVPAHLATMATKEDMKEQFADMKEQFAEWFRGLSPSVQAATQELPQQPVGSSSLSSSALADPQLSVEEMAALAAAEMRSLQLQYPLVCWGGQNASCASSGTVSSGGCDISTDAAMAHAERISRSAAIAVAFLRGLPVRRSERGRVDREGGEIVSQQGQDRGEQRAGRRMQIRPLAEVLWDLQQPIVSTASGVCQGGIEIALLQSTPEEEQRQGSALQRLRAFIFDSGR